MAASYFRNRPEWIVCLVIELVAGPGSCLIAAAAAEPKSAPTQDLFRPTTLFDQLIAAIESPATETFPDEPAARAVYNTMIEALRQARSLSYTSHYVWGAKGRVLGDCIYRAWLKKPNYFRIEAESVQRSEHGGVLIGDGNKLWIHWPKGRVKFSIEDSEVYEKTRLKSYMTKRAPLAGHSIGHEVPYLGAGMTMPVLDPSTFHGYTDSLQAYIDGVRSLGTDQMEGEACDRIEVSIMKRQRSWYLWISQRDHLPRRLEQTVRVSHDIIMREEWSSLVLDADIPETLFAWKPPEGWTEWKLPKPEERLLKPGTKAPEFDMASISGSRIKLADYRGQIVWLYFWRAG